MRLDYWLLMGGLLSFAAAVAHLACIVGGPDWYRFFGAGEGMARAAEAGSPTPAILTSAIAAMLAIWGVYALSGAGLIGRLPLLRGALIAITAVYLLRGAVLFFPDLLRRPDLSPAFLRWSSLIVLTLGLIHAIGTWRVWPSLNGEA